jgi:hypothetical protein
VEEDRKGKGKRVAEEERRGEESRVEKSREE